MAAGFSANDERPSPHWTRSEGPSPDSTRPRAGAATVASWEAGTGGTLLSILAAVEPSAGGARFVGGVLDGGAPIPAPVADAVIQLSLHPTDAHGRSRVRVSVSGAADLPTVEVRVHGSGIQRQRRAAFAALDQVRRAFAG